MVIDDEMLNAMIKNVHLYGLPSLKLEAQITNHRILTKFFDNWNYQIKLKRLVIKKNNKINDHHIDLLSKSYNFPLLRELELIDCSKLSDKSIVSLLT
jgi:hypothetical protein